MNVSQQIKNKLEYINNFKKENKENNENFNKLTELYSKVLTLSYQCNNVNDIKNVIKLFAGFIEKDNYKYDFLPHIAKTLKIAKARKSFELEVECLCLKGREYFKAGDRKAAIAALQEAQAKNKSKNTKIKIRILLNFALMFKEIGLYQKALESLNEIEQLHQKENLELTREMASYYNVLGTIFRDFETYDKALKYYKKALASYKILKYPKGMAKVYNNIGILHERQHEYEKSLENLNNALELKKQLNLSLATTLAAFGNVYLGQMKLEKAEANYEASLKIREATHNTKQIISIKSSLGRLYLKQKKYAKSEAILKKCEQEAIAKAFDNLLEKNYLTLEELYEQTKNYEQAFFNSKKLRKISRKIQTKRYQENLVINDTLNRMREKELEITNQKRKTNEVKHRVKNHFGVLNALIEQLKRRKIEQIGIEKVEACIYAMTSLNEMLYNINELKPKTDLANFLVSLTDKVQLVHQNLHEFSQRIVIKNKLEPNVMLKANSCLDLGLIVAEMITNSYKYAFDDFNDTEIPIINIDLKKNEAEKLIILEVKDNGCGWKEDATKKDSFGTTFINNYVEQLDGKIIWPKINEKGACYRINLPL